MTTIWTKPTADLVAPPEPTSRHRADSVEARRVRWRLALDFAWQRKIDEVIALSKAFCKVTSDDDGGQATRGTRARGRLQTRTQRAYDELATIEEAMARLHDKTYGMCADCNQAMSDEWLADTPAVRYCPDCSLRRVCR